jgi:ammonium transporter, Amt family
MATVNNFPTVQLTTENRKLLLGVITTLLVGILIGVGGSLLAPTSARAYDPKDIDTGNTAWVLAASALVMIMTPAVGFFYGGMVRSKNVVSAIKQSVVILALVSVQWVLFGYSLAFGTDIGGGFLGGLGFFGLNGVGYAPNPAYAATIPLLTHMIFQAMFAIITPALIIGAFVERIRFRTFVVFILLWSTLVYDPIAHWVWSPGGWLHNLGVLDFAGGTVVHASSGFAALAAAIVIGKRFDFQKGEPVEANNIPLTILGAVLLWFGWFGFNAGSALAASPLAVNAFVVTNTSAAAAALTWMALSWVQNGRPGALPTATGAVCGLVVITPASGYVSPLSSIVIGILGGLVTYLMLVLRNKLTNVDDTLDVWAVHGMGGLTGALLTGLFAEKVINPVAGNNGLLFGNPQQLLIQIIAVLATIVYAFVVTFLILKFLTFMGLRVNQREEIMGLDLAAHGEEGYRMLRWEETETRLQKRLQEVETKIKELQKLE